MNLDKLNAGDFDKKIQIVSIIKTEDSRGFPVDTETVVLNAYANVITTRGFTLITSHTDFEKAYTKFTIRYQKAVEITREMFIRYGGKLYSIEYIDDVNEEHIIFEIEAKEVTK